jgi:hypothetical protein
LWPFTSSQGKHVVYIPPWKKAKKLSLLYKTRNQRETCGESDTFFLSAGNELARVVVLLLLRSLIVLATTAAETQIHE